MAGGRPSSYKPEYCEMLIKHMESGLSFQSFGADVRCNIDTLHEWVKKHPEFSDAKKEGELLSLKIWEKIGMNGMMGKIKGFNVVCWIFNMKNRFKWRDGDPFADIGEVDRTFVLAYEIKKKEK